MNQEQNISDRKLDHIRINLEEDVRSKRSTGLEQIELIHSALPELDLDQVDPSVVMWKKRLSIPLLISSMTGGNQEAAQINRNLAVAAQQHQIAMGLGSMRAALVRPESLETFQVRQWAPDILLFANFGAVQLNYGYSADDCRRLIDLVEADGLILHLNPLQEALQPEGDSRFGLLLPKIEAVCRQLEQPVIVKEVGWGISSAVARRYLMPAWLRSMWLARAEHPGRRSKSFGLRMKAARALRRLSADGVFQRRNRSKPLLL
jgi:isopentenyl-diphosphate delta-isomerase